jgi:hypothetical protein
MGSELLPHEIQVEEDQVKINTLKHYDPKREEVDDGQKILMINER